MLWGKNKTLVVVINALKVLPEESEINAKKSIAVTQLDNVIVQYFKHDWCVNLFSTFSIKFEYITYFIKKQSCVLQTRN